MKVLLIDGASPLRGQAGHLSGLAKGLRNRGHIVAVSCNHERPDKALAASQVPVFQTGWGRQPDVLAICGLARRIKDEAFDVVHTHGTRAGLIGRTAARLAGCPKVIHTMHALSSDLVRATGLRGRAARLAYTCADKWLARWTTTIIADSEDVRRQAIRQGIPKSKVVTIHPGVDLSCYQRPGDRCLARRRLGIPTGCKVVGTISHFTRRDNPADLLQAASILSKRFDDLLFVLVGDGKEMPSLRRLAKDLGVSHRVLFPGCRGDAPEIIRAFDVFALPSLSEGCPLSLLEAMAAGLPVVAPDIAGVRETVEDGAAGHIVPPSDPASLAAGIRRIFEEEREHEMGTAGRERAMRLFGLDRMVEHIEKVYLGRMEPDPTGVPAAAVN